jgi:hypothetical protein
MEPRIGNAPMSVAYETTALLLSYQGKWGRRSVLPRLRNGYRPFQDAVLLSGKMVLPLGAAPSLGTNQVRYWV